MAVLIRLFRSVIKTVINLNQTIEMMNKGELVRLDLFTARK